LKKSKKFRDIIEIVLVIGNYINGGSNRGEAFGFKLSSLGKLHDTKTTDNKSTLFVYIIGYVKEKKPELLDLQAELQHVLEASRVPFTTTVGDVNNLKKEFKQVSDSVSSMMNKDDPKNAQFADRFSNFIKAVESEMSKFDARVSQLNDEYATVAKLFAEDPKVTPPDEFFSLINKFLGDMDATVKQFEFSAASKEREARQEDARQKRREQLANKKEGKKTDEKKSTYSSLLKDMQSGQAYKKNREKAPAGGRDMMAAALQEAKQKQQYKSSNNQPQQN